MALIVRSNIRKVVQELDKESSIGSVSEEFELELEKRTEDLILNAIKRARANKRRTLQARDL